MDEIAPKAVLKFWCEADGEQFVTIRLTFRMHMCSAVCLASLVRKEHCVVPDLTGRELDQYGLMIFDAEEMKDP